VASNTTRTNGDLAELEATWKALRDAPAADPRGNAAAGRMVSIVRALIARDGDFSNLILDDNLDTYYLMDITVNVIPQTQQRLGELTLQLGDWLRAGQAASHALEIAVQAAMLRQDDRNRILKDAQISLSQDRNFYGTSASLQKNLPPSIAACQTAIDAFAAQLERVIAGQAASPEEVEAAGWRAREACHQLWQTSAAELDQLLAMRITNREAREETACVNLCLTLALVAIVLGWVIRSLLLARYREIAATEEELRRREQRLRALGDNLPNSAVYQVARTADGTMKHLYVSAGIERLNGISAQALMQDYTLFQRQVLPEDMPKLLAARNESIATKQPFAVVVRIRRTDGAVRWMRYSSAIHSQPDGTFVWDGIQTDITEEVKKEEQINHLNRIYAVISGINHAIVHEKNSLALFERACRIAVGEGQFRMAWIGMLDSTTQELRAAASCGAVEGYPAVQKIDLRDPEQAKGPAARCVVSGQHAICNDIEHDPLYLPWREEALRRGYRSSAGFPLKVGGRVVGVFNLYAGEPDFFDEQEVRLLLETVEDLSFALEVNRLEKERQEAELALKQSEARFSHIFKTSPIPITLSRLDDGSIVDTNDSYLRMSGFARAEVIGRTALELNLYPEPADRARIIDQVRQHGHLHQHHQKFRAKSGEIRDHILWLDSLTINGEGYLLVVALDITERLRVERRLEMTSRQLRDLTARLQTLREDERAHLSRDIHDHLGQLLTALSLDLRLIERKLAGVADPELRAALAGKIASARILANETISAVQKIATELRPAALDRLGLAAAIEAEAQSFQERTGVRCQWTLPSFPLALDPEQSTALFRIFQEMLTNVARHSRAANLVVQLSQGDDTLVLEVQDDGVGIGADDIENPRSLGLLGIRERAARLGGTVEFRRNGANGTKAVVEIPLNERTEQVP
jgi:PAS domain S-box-containing protein